VYLHPSLSVSAFAVVYLCTTLLLGWPSALVLASAGFFTNQATLRRRRATETFAAP
jgi:hypothetical protein